LSPEVTDALDEVMRAYEYAPASETKVTSPSEVQEAIKDLKVGKAPGPNGVPNRALKHLRKRDITFITKLFNAVLRKQYFPPEWKHAHVVSIMMPGLYPLCFFPADPLAYSRRLANSLNDPTH
jgi:hypothetical protein